MVLDFLRLILVPCRRLLSAYALDFFLKALLLISEGLEGQDQLFDLVLALLQHFLLFPHVGIQAFPLTSTLLLIPSAILDLAVLYLDELAQILVFFLESLVFGDDRFFFLLGLRHPGFILLLLITQLSDFPLQIGHELVLLADHVRDRFFGGHQQVGLLRRFGLVLKELVLGIGS